jgi:hypothetical protein
MGVAEWLRNRFEKLYLAAGITITCVAFPSFLSEVVPLRVMSEEPSREVDQDDPELLRVWNEFPSGEVVSVEPVVVSRVTKELPSLLLVCC